ncbi:MAG: hemolysin family protein [Candidatus Promineifilaceae bacterium]|nr:hemolysin family protein [Candidatus Promineifilaceae bacterium]
MALLIPLIIILILVLLNGMYVAAEFAILGVRETRVAQLAREGNKTAQRLLRTLEDRAQVDRYIASAQLGITIASLGLGMYGEPAIAHFIEEPLHDYFGLEGAAVHTVAFLIALGLITYLHVVVGEMVPKSLALQFAERTVLLLARPMALMQTIFGPAITVLNGIGMAVLKALGVPPPKEKSRLHTPDELEMIISEGVVGGVIEAHQFALFENIFDLDDLDVDEMMTPRVKVDAVSLSVDEETLARKFGSSPFSRFPVYEGSIDNIVGVVHIKDFVNQQLEGRPFDMQQLMHEPLFLPRSASAYELLSAFETHRVHLAVVLGEYGGTTGIVTLEDLLEEVVGEVWDEFDIDPHDPVTVLGPGHLLAQGSARLDEVKPYVDLTPYAEDVTTVGGLMLANLNLPLHRNDQIAFDDVTLCIEDLEGMTVEAVSIFFPPEEAEASEAEANAGGH